jgi:hypothetical protein
MGEGFYVASPERVPLFGDGITFNYNPLAEEAPNVP